MLQKIRRSEYDQWKWEESVNKGYVEDRVFEKGAKEARSTWQTEKLEPRSAAGILVVSGRLDPFTLIRHFSPKAVCF